ncbi:hypothetical protein FB446DRAFT_776547 [Lentinula raphanica]|nr:hypothetical protein FB446DRAFT_776547 [Lentinula raphanica]
MYLWTLNNPAVKICSRNRYHINWFPPDALTTLTNPFMFYFKENHTPTAMNCLMRRKTRPYNNNVIPSFHGNLLIIKHDREGAVDMETRDWPLVKVILDWLVINRGEYDLLIFSTLRLLESHPIGQRLPSQATPPRDAHEWQVLTSTLLVQFIREYSPVLSSIPPHGNFT